MPRFVDFHAKLPLLPPEAVDMMKSHVGMKDAFGVTAQNAYITKDGQGYCITEAPNAQAVCDSHKAVGITLEKGDVHEVMVSLA